MGRVCANLHRGLSRGLFGWAILTGLTLTVSGANCIGPWQPPDDNKPRAAGLRGFSSAEELRLFLAEQAKSRLTTNQGGWGSWWFLPMPMSAPTDNSFSFDDRGDGDMAAEGGGGDGTPYSSTNIQEVGVDESDIVKNNDQHIYWLRGSTIRVVAATPAEAMSEVAKIELDAPGDSLYLRGNQLIAITRNWKYEIMDDGWGGGTVDGGDTSDGGGSGSSEPGGSPPSGTETVAKTGRAMAAATMPWFDGSEVVVTVIDVSTPASPAKQATLKFEGELATSRLIGNRLYLVTTTTPAIPVSSLTAIESMTLEEWLPAYEVDRADGQTQTGTIASWDSFYRPIAGDGYGITTAITIDLDNPSATFDSTAITADAGVIYASPQALYVTDTKYDWESNGSRTDTMVHKLAFTDSGTDYVGSGLVPGRPLNQYSLGEYQNFLRIATTEEQFSPTTGANSTNSVYVLGENGTDLEVVGRVEDLGIGEQIYAARFIGPRGFVVTFKRIDPLFTLDLSDPTNPRVIGELKIPGYSDHIQLMDENHLLTIGKDAQDAGEWGAWVQGVQLSIFDVSDLANPTLKHKEVIGGRGTNSEANYNPKAFNYFPARDALAFPIDLYGGDTAGPEYGDYEFTGLMVYRATIENGFEELGRISTVPENQPSRGCWWGYSGSARGVFIGDNVYAVSDLGVKSAPIEDASDVLDEVDFADTAPQEDCYWIEPLILPEVAGGLR
ncbi:MAG TPA: beta-propeller domain-containing protein [Phycisphaerae bacterium]|nr:beta-propeller domain-containing protein [Phycisphaerae bacterium]